MMAAATDVTDETARDRAVGVLLGLAIGDAIGTTLEFAERDALPAVTGMIGGGQFGLDPGQWTDDTSMALCLADSLLERGRLPTSAAWAPATPASNRQVKAATD